jgi:1-acyl-sn-glycerol-3-phosphate acyltransferase
MIRYFLTLVVFTAIMIHAAAILPLHILSGRKIGKGLVGFTLRMVLWVNRVKLDVSGRENIDPSKKYLIVSNHQSVFDIPIVGAAVGIDLRIFAKKELSKIPLFGQLLYFYDFVFVDRVNKREAVKNLKKASEVMKKYSFLVFPEGTRSVDGKVQPFKTGAVSLAQGNHVNILPVAVLDSYKVMPKGKLVINPGTVKVRIFKPITVDENVKRKDIAKHLHSIISEYVENNL